MAEPTPVRPSCHIPGPNGPVCECGPTPAEIEAGAWALVAYDLAHGLTANGEIGPYHRGETEAVLAAVLPEHDAPAAAVAVEWQHPSNGRSDLYRRAVRDRLREQWPQLATALDDLARAHSTGEDDHA